MNFYNENDPKAAGWLRALIADNLIPNGEVDERSITEISPHELTPYTQCHFFAGIGGWPLALALAGWPASRPVWTGSCPCQPFSSAGQGKGAGDDRHLWPVFHRLVSKLRPERIFGEQVAQAIGFDWLDGISADLEADGYAVGAAVLGAHSVGAPHIRQRLYWVADSIDRRSQNRWSGHHGKNPQSDCGRNSNSADVSTSQELRATGGLANAQHDGRRTNEPGREAQGGVADWRASGMGDAEGQRIDGGSRTTQGTIHQERGKPIVAIEDMRLGDPASGGCGIVRDAAQPGSGGHALGAGWARFEIVHCRDGKARRFEPGSFPLADGLPGRVGLLRGYGNAIVPQVAAEFIQAFLEFKP